MKGPGECHEAPEANIAVHRLSTLSQGFQGVEDLKTTLTTGLEVGAKAKTCETIVTHVKADLENTPQPPTWRAKCRRILCRKNTGYHTKDPKI
jgi:hypothetical protein